MKSRTIADLVAINIFGGLIFAVVLLIIRSSATAKNLQAHEARRHEMCDRLELMFGGAADVAQHPPYTTETRTWIQTDLAVFAPVAEGCIAIPPATNWALGHLDNDQALQAGALELGRALTDAKTRRWPL